MTAQRRFTLAVIVTVLVVAYVVVPWVADLIEGMAAYDPVGAEIKKFARGERPGGGDAVVWTPEVLVKAGLFVLLAVVWFVAANGRRSR